MSGLAQVLMLGGAAVSLVGGVVVMTAGRRAQPAAAPADPTILPQFAQAAAAPRPPLTQPVPAQPIQAAPAPSAPVQSAPIPAQPAQAQTAPVSSQAVPNPTTPPQTAAVPNPTTPPPGVVAAEPAPPPGSPDADTQSSAAAPMGDLDDVGPPPVIPPPPVVEPVVVPAEGALPEDAAEPTPADIAATQAPPTVEPPPPPEPEPLPAEIAPAPTATEAAPPAGLPPRERLVAALGALGVSADQASGMFDQAEALTSEYAELPPAAALAARCLNIIEFEDPTIFTHENAREQLDLFLRGVLGAGARVIWPQPGDDSSEHEVVGGGAGPVNEMALPGFEYTDAAGARQVVRAVVRTA